jgi:hypothetical protein
MEEEKLGVDSQSAAPSTGVENTSVNAPTDDPEARLKAVMQELEQTRQERDKDRRDKENYRNGFLALKGKREMEDLDLTDPVQLEAYITKTVQDRLLSSKETQLETDYRRQAEENAKKVKELTYALNNRPTIPTGAGSGSSTEETKSPAKSDYWSEAQVADLKKRGWTDDVIKRAADHARLA